ncbi:MAG: alpha/beta hydrolase [Promicromonosporaceae bacterium]|nr:alpha/beta hydrolase [Promicromonosporaceae bacterium]
MKPKLNLALHELHDGSGMPVVLLHPFPVDSRAWVPMANALPPGIRVIAVDLPGFGKSDLGGLAPSIDLAADAVYDSLTAYGIGNAIVIGWSMGGYVALALAERHPGFVAGLGLVGSRAGADSADMAANRLRLAREVEMAQSVQPISALVSQVMSPRTLEERRQLFSTIEAWMRSQLPAGVAWAQRAMARRPDRTHVLKNFDGPVTIIMGQEDRMNTVQNAKEMAQAAKHGYLTIVPGAAHFVAIEDPQAVAQAIAKFHNVVAPHTRTGSIPKVTRR